MRRGQLTIIIIIALLLLIMVGIVLYTARSVAIQKGEERLQTQQRTAALLQPVQDYVGQCLDLAARTALEQLGLQGGVLYQAQQGITPDPFVAGTDHVPVDLVKVPYAIIPPQGKIGAPGAEIFFSDIPDYPWGTFPALYDGSTLLVASYLQGYFGINKLPQPLRPDQQSVQEQLETATLAKTTGCLQWTIFAQQGITVTEAGPPTLQAVFGDRGTSFLLHFPLDVKSDVTGTTSRADTFAIEVPVRMESILETAHVVADADATNVTFDPSSLVINEMQVSTQRSVFQGDDLVRVVDPRSTLAGHQYLFQLGRKNRAPALVWIPNDTLASKLICDSTVLAAQQSALLVDTSSCNGDSFSGTFTISMQAFDPDEDNVTVRFEAGPSLTQLPPNTYTVTTGDASFGLIQIIATVIDSHGLSDFQTLFIPVDFNPPPPSP